MSWASRIEKLVRPVAVDMRRWLESTSITIAVDDRARQEPMMTAAAAGAPAHATTAAIADALSSTCRKPRPNTSRRIVRRRW
jgi:hypothetical protein